jgi:hypothetical protein
MNKFVLNLLVVIAEPNNEHKQFKPKRQSCAPPDQ